MQVIGPIFNRAVIFLPDRTTSLKTFVTLQTIFLLILVSGCRNTIFETRSRIVLENPIEAKIPPIGPNGPLKPVCLQGNHGASGPSLALIEIDGLLLHEESAPIIGSGQSAVGRFRESLDRIASDTSIRGVLIRINSPGGSVNAAETMRADLLRFKAQTQLPVVACSVELATGGSYYLASAADKIVANPGSLIGGVGVILNLYNLRDLMAVFNIIPQEIKAGLNVDMGTNARAMTPESKKWLQGIADEFQANLKSGIFKSRPQINLDEGRTLDGRIFSPREALNRKLIDQIGSLDEGIALLRELTGLPQAQLITLRRDQEEAQSIHDRVSGKASALIGGLPSIPGLERSKLPTFLSIWQPDLTLTNP
jgi:protease IV